MTITTVSEIRQAKMDKCKIILIALLCLLALAYFWWYEPCEEPGYGDYSKRIKNLQMKNDSLKVMNRKLDNQLVRLKSQTDSLKKLVSVDRQVISELKKSESERIKAIDDFNNDELFRFFAGLKTGSTAN